MTTQKKMMTQNSDTEDFATTRSADYRTSSDLVNSC